RWSWGNSAERSRSPPVLRAAVPAYGWSCRFPSRTRLASYERGSGAGSHADAAALECPALVLAEPAPHAGVLTAVECPLQASLGHFAPGADLLRLINLEQGRAGVPDREEQLRVDVTTGGVTAPVHAVHSSSRTNGPSPGPLPPSRL